MYFTKVSGHKLKIFCISELCFLSTSGKLHDLFENIIITINLLRQCCCPRTRYDTSVITTSACNLDVIYAGYVCMKTLPNCRMILIIMIHSASYCCFCCLYSYYCILNHYYVLYIPERVQNLRYIQNWVQITSPCIQKLARCHIIRQR